MSAAPSNPPYLQSIGGCLAPAIGAHGLDAAMLDAALARLESPLRALKVDAETGRLPLLTLPRETRDIELAEAALARLMTGAKTIVFFGTGGSGLGGQLSLIHISEPTRPY